MKPCANENQEKQLKYEPFWEYSATIFWKFNLFLTFFAIFYNIFMTFFGQIFNLFFRALVIT